MDVWTACGEHWVCAWAGSMCVGGVYVHGVGRIKCTSWPVLVHPTRNIMQDLVKNLARIWQESGKILNVSYVSCKILETYKNILVRSCLGSSCKILQEYSYKVFECLSG